MRNCSAPRSFPIAVGSLLLGTQARARTKTRTENHQDRIYSGLGTSRQRFGDTDRQRAKIPSATILVDSGLVWFVEPSQPNASSMTVRKARPDAGTMITTTTTGCRSCFSFFSFANNDCYSLQCQSTIALVLSLHPQVLTVVHTYCQSFKFV